MDIVPVFWGTVLRTVQALIEASPTLACGFLVAGIFRKMLGPAGTRRLFGNGGFSGLLRAWGVGMVLTVCSLGAIPIAREMCRAGVRSGTILAFVLSAPHINPVSLLYGMTLSEPVVILCFAAASLVISLSAGALWEALFASSEAVALPEEPLPAPGPKRLLAVLLAASSAAAGPSLLYCVIGLLGTGILAGLIPFGALQHAMSHGDPLSVPFMTLIALPAYNAPLQGMMKLGLMFEHGNSVGAAFSLFELGIGVNVGLVVWLGHVFGWRRVLVWLGILTAVVVALGYAAEPTLYFAKEEANHTHAFDDFSNPFPATMAVTAGDVYAKLLEKLGSFEMVSLAGLALFVVLGLTARRAERRWDLEGWLSRQPPATDRPRAIWNRNVPGPVLGLVALAGLVVFSVISAYLYYPDKEEVFDQIAHVRADALTAVRLAKREEAIRRLEQWDLLTRKLQVGVYLREWQRDPDKAEKADDLRERLEEVRDALLAGRLQEAKQMVRGDGPLETAHYVCREAFTGRPPPGKAKGR